MQASHICVRPEQVRLSMESDSGTISEPDLSSIPPLTPTRSQSRARASPTSPTQNRFETSLNPLLAPEPMAPSPTGGAPGTLRQSFPHAQTLNYEGFSEELVSRPTERSYPHGRSLVFESAPSTAVPTQPVQRTYPHGRSLMSESLRMAPPPAPPQARSYSHGHTFLGTSAAQVPCKASPPQLPEPPKKRISATEFLKQLTASRRGRLGGSSLGSGGVVVSKHEASETKPKKPAAPHDPRRERAVPMQFASAAPVPARRLSASFPHQQAFGSCSQGLKPETARSASRDSVGGALITGARKQFLGFSSISLGSAAMAAFKIVRPQSRSYPHGQSFGSSKLSFC